MKFHYALCCKACSKPLLIIRLPSSVFVIASNTWVTLRPSESSNSPNWSSALPHFNSQPVTGGKGASDIKGLHKAKYRAPACQVSCLTWMMYEWGAGLSPSACHGIATCWPTQVAELAVKFVTSMCTSFTVVTCANICKRTVKGTCRVRTHFDVDQLHASLNRPPSVPFWVPTCVLCACCTFDPGFVLASVWCASRVTKHVSFLLYLPKPPSVGWASEPPDM